MASKDTKQSLIIKMYALDLTAKRLDKADIYHHWRLFDYLPLDIAIAVHGTIFIVYPSICTPSKLSSIASQPFCSSHGRSSCVSHHTKTLRTRPFRVMADPFSILAGTVGLIDICTRLDIYLKDVEKAAEHVDEAINILVEDLNMFGIVTRHIKEAYEDYADRKDSDEKLSQDHARQLWTTVERVLQGCRVTLDKLWALIEEIKGKEKDKPLSPRLRGFMKQLRKQSRQEDYNQYRRDLGNSLSALQVTLNLVGL